MRDIGGEYVAATCNCVAKIFKGKLGPLPEELIGFHSQFYYICKYYGYSEDGDSLCLLMEKYDCSVRQSIDKQMEKGRGKRRPFHDRVAMSIIIQIAIGMAYLHHLNILHRDLKAENIFLNMNGDDTSPSIFIGDFDDAPCVEGTGFWRAPEILEVIKDREDLNKKGCVVSSLYKSLRTVPFTTKSDVYSFGMTCYEILTGSIPFEETYRCNYEVVLSGKRPKLPSNLNPKMKNLLNKCWHQDSEARPTFMQIVMELKDFVEGTESLMSHFSFVYTFRKISASDPEANLVELKRLVHVLANKYNQEDFVVLGLELVDAIEQFQVEFGLRSFIEQPALPFSKWLSRLVLLDTVAFKRQMFLAECPSLIPDYTLIFMFIQVIFNDTMRAGSTSSNARIIREDNITTEDMSASWKAWEEERKRRPQLHNNDLLELQKVLGKRQPYITRHQVCLELLTSKHDIGRDIFQPCDFCTSLCASKPPHLEVCTFQLYPDNYVTLKSVVAYMCR